MKRALLLLGGLWKFSNASAQTDTFTVNGTPFITQINQVKSDYGKTDKLLKLYRLEQGKPVYLLSHYLYMFTPDHNNEFTDKGTFTVRHDSLIFNTVYLQKTGIDPIPDSRQQIYKVLPAGKVILISDKTKPKQ